MRDPCLIELDKVSLALGGVAALSGVSLVINRGERLGVIGGNGSGKSSLLRVIHGLIPPSAGSVRRATGVRMALVFQKPHLLRDTVIANVALGLRLRGVGTTDALDRANAALVSVGLADIARRNARTLSGGQAQRVALARALTLSPDVLLLDEPTASLDPRAKDEVEAIMQKLSEAGCTLVLASHNFGQIKRLATHVICLGAGRVLAGANSQAFFNQPLPPEAAAFVKGESL